MVMLKARRGAHGQCQSISTPRSTILLPSRAPLAWAPSHKASTARARLSATTRTLASGRTASSRLSLGSSDGRPDSQGRGGIGRAVARRYLVIRHTTVAALQRATRDVPIVFAQDAKISAIGSVGTDTRTRCWRAPQRCRRMFRRDAIRECDCRVSRNTRR